MGFIKRALFERMKRRGGGFPKLLSIELTSRCNARCIMCPRQQLKREARDMSFETLEKVVKSCKNQPLRKANLFWMGDPLMHPQFMDYLTYVRKELPKVKLYISTNAGLLSEEKSRAIVDEQLLDVINFDMDGVTKKTYESIRRNVDFDEMTKNVHFMFEYRKRQKKRRPELRATIIEMKPNQHEVAAFIEYWTPLADKVDVTQYHTWLGAVDELTIDEKLARTTEGSFDFACNHPWDEMAVAADGRAGLCCLDYNLTETIGDVNHETLEEIWTGERMKECRRKLCRLAYDELRPCRDCNAYIYQQRTTWRKMQI